MIDQIKLKKEDFDEPILSNVIKELFKENSEISIDLDLARKFYLLI